MVEFSVVYIQPHYLIMIDFYNLVPSKTWLQDYSLLTKLELILFIASQVVIP